MRRIPLDRFIPGPGQTTLARDEILVAIYLPPWNPVVSRHCKVSVRMVNTVAKVSMAAALWGDAGIITKARMAMGAVGPTVIRCVELEQKLEGLTFRDAARSAKELAALAGKAVRPIDDNRSTAAYRHAVAVNLAAAFLSGSETAPSSS
jgi:xanthine dehydrogenase FAD-binding subunit